MTAAELIIKMVMDATGMRAEAERVEGRLDEIASSAARAEKQMGDMGRTGEASLRELNARADRAGEAFLSLAKSVGGVVAGFITVDAILDSASAYYEQADAIGRTSESLGLSVERMQAWQAVAVQTGGEAEEMADRFRDMSDYIIDAVQFDAGPLKDIAAKLSIPLKTAQGEARATEDVMLDLAGAFQKVGKQASTAYGMQMSMDPATIALLQKGRGELEAMLKVQQEQAAFAAEDAEIARKQKLAMLELDRSWQGFVNGLMRLAAPAILSITEKLGTVTTFLQDNAPAIGMTLGVLAAVIAKSVAPALFILAKAGLAAAAPFAPFIAAAVALGVALDDLAAFVDGGNSAFEQFLRWLGLADESVEAVREAVKSLFGLFSSLFSLDGNKILQALDQVQQAFGNLFGRIGGWLKDLLPDWVKKLMGGGDSTEDSGGLVRGASAFSPETEKKENGSFMPDWVKKLMVGDSENEPAFVKDALSLGTHAAQNTTVNNTSRTSNVQSSTSIGTINIETKATDAPGIAQGIGAALRNMSAQADGAFGA